MLNCVDRLGLRVIPGHKPGTTGGAVVHPGQNDLPRTAGCLEIKDALVPKAGSKHNTVPQYAKLLVWMQARLMASDSIQLATLRFLAFGAPTHTQVATHPGTVGQRRGQ